MIREAWEHTEKRRTGDAAISQEGRMEEASEEEVGEGEEGGGGGGGGRGGDDEQKGQRPFGCLSESLGMSFWERLGGLLGRLGGLLAVPGASWSVLDASGERLGASWGPLVGILGASWRPLGASWALAGAILEAINKKRGWLLLGSPCRSLQMGILGLS